jgi:hypothetical protein
MEGRAEEEIRAEGKGKGQSSRDSTPHLTVSTEEYLGTLLYSSGPWSSDSSPLSSSSLKGHIANLVESAVPPR